jgi:hypothetical protein
MIKIYTDLDKFIYDYEKISDRDLFKSKLEKYGHLLLIDNIHYCGYVDRCKDTDCSLKEECFQVYRSYLRQQKLERITNE